MQHRIIKPESGFTSGRLRTFYLDDGSKYAWTRGTKYLERFINPGGADEETRERVAKVKLMRQWKFDYEMIIDESKIDTESALATGFICMMTFWGVGDITETVGPTQIPEENVKEEEDKEETIEEKPINDKPKESQQPIKEESVEDQQEKTPNITVVVDSNNDADLIVEKA